MWSFWHSSGTNLPAGRSHQCYEGFDIYVGKALSAIMFVSADSDAKDAGAQFAVSPGISLPA